MNIAQSVILVTAAGSPLGKAIALHFSTLGAQIALVDHDKAALAETLSACRTIQADCQSYVVAHHDEQSIAALISAIDEQFGKIDVLLNCWLSTPLPSLLGPTSVDQFSQCLADSVAPFFLFGQHTAHYMRQHHRQGVIINLALNDDCHYPSLNSGSKAVVSGLTASWAKELAEFNIRVGGVVPLSRDDDNAAHYPLLSSPLQYEIVRSAEYIVANDYFNGRMIEAEVS